MGQEHPLPGGRARPGRPRAPDRGRELPGAAHLTGPDLKTFFAAFGRYLADPGDARAAELCAELDWQPNPARLRIYGNHARLGVGNMLASVFQGCRESLPAEEWARLLRDYYATRPADHFELNKAGRAFPGFVATRAAELPRFLPELAAFEWQILTTYQDPREIPAQVEGLTVNPTLETLQHAFRLCPYLANERQAPPLEEDELALVWRHPQSYKTRYATASARLLLALKIALEEIPLARAAEEGGVELDEIERVIEEAVERGLLLR